MLRRMVQPLRFADFAVGQRFQSGTHTLTVAEIKDFAAQFDPQPFHMDEAAAAASAFGALVASGWHTACVTMRLLVEGGMPIAGGILGAGIDELRWLRPVRPGDTLRVESEVLEIMPSASRPGQGRMRVAARTFNQDGVQVLGWIGTLVVRG
jgi:acyl dehydratase